ncbi:hypothetical protein PENANT_c189G02360 [Penicillium antarcticum]|uniref:Uncharacterized protein n=1 Tax=Penicillium antarcticum TaxID=416450 RepID=A0A1V6PAZ3_9EURO|nr:hypothetical protein PENANT_c189G02360 [Penicillium antarcticum]
MEQQRQRSSTTARNDAADRLAKDAASPGKTHPFRPFLRALIRDKIRAQWEREWKASTKGGHLRKIDSTLPAAYTRKLYGNLSRGRAYLLTQLRTGHNWLSTYAKTFGFRDNNHVSSLLGGSTEGERGNPDTVSRARTVKAVLDFAEASQRFQSRAP